MAGPHYTDAGPSYPFPAESGQSPDAVPYPNQQRGRFIAAIAVMATVLVATIIAVIYALAVNSDGSARSGRITEASAKAAIQDYLDAMQKGDTETVARNMACGLYDEVKDQRSDKALARLGSETFRKQIAKATVTSIDKIVLLSPNQAQVLFSEQVTSAGRGTKNREQQAVAQLLLQDDELLVCSYVPKTNAQY
jgi:ketosteroid isomerase-like protein